MLKRYLPYLAFAVVVVACGKDKLESRPSLKIKGVNGSEIPPGAELIINLEFTDKEGDLGGGIITYVRNRLNSKPITDPNSNDKADTVNQILPDFPKTTTGEIQLKISNAFMTEDPFDNDTMFFKIYVADINNNVSDTLTTGTVIDRQN